MLPRLLTAHAAARRPGGAASRPAPMHLPPNRYQPKHLPPRGHQPKHLPTGCRPPNGH